MKKRWETHDEGKPANEFLRGSSKGKGRVSETGGIRGTNPLTLGSQSKSQRNEGGRRNSYEKRVKEREGRGEARRGKDGGTPSPLLCLDAPSVKGQKGEEVSRKEISNNTDM